MPRFRKGFGSATASTVQAMREARVMIVTGASSGIGRSLAMLAAKDGWRVLLVARDSEGLEMARDRIRTAGGTAESLLADVVDAATPKRIVDATLRAFGRIDALVNNAGHGAPGPLLEQSDAALRTQWETHVAAPLRIARAALPSLRESRGVLVFVGSGLARCPAPYYGGYCAAKAAIRAASTQLRRELREFGIAVTYVDPGVVDTNFSESAGMQRERESFATSPERVARAMLRAIERRSRVVNVVPLHALAVMLGEFFPKSSDIAMSHLVAAQAAPRAPTEPASALPAHRSSNGFDAALAPLARRMERVKLAPSFVRSLVQDDAHIELGEAAMRWAGMPNKNERAALREVFDALTSAGYLESTGDETWAVRRAAD